MPKLIGDKPLTASERAKRYYYKNAEAEKERSKLWRINNPEKAREHQRKSWHKNREKNLARQKLYQLNNLDKFSDYERTRRVRKLNNETYKISKKDMRRIKTSSCSSCGSKNLIQIDHIIPVSRGGSHGIGNLQPLCKSCNISKGARFIMEWRLSKKVEI